MAGQIFAVPATVTALTFACLVGIMWGAYNPHSGMPYETAFPYMSETTNSIQGFLFDDPMRVHTSTFYHLSYLLGKALGIIGSYVPYQVVYALLWWARGMLVFAILRRFLPTCPSLCFSAGAFAVVHSSDGAMMWVGQMNQFGFIFWMLLAMYCFLWAWDYSRWWQVVPLTAMAVVAEYMSLWSYESQILLILAFPVAIVLARSEWRKPGRLFAWYVVPAAYLIASYLRYTHSGGSSYQESVMRKSWSLASITGDWVFNIAASLEFWDWARPEWRAPHSTAYVLSALAALIFGAGWMAVIRLERGRGAANPFAGGLRSCWSLLAGGIVALAFSFPVYLLLDADRNLWRTQFLSGIGCGIVLAAILGLLSWLPLRNLGRMATVVTAGAAIVYAGSVSAIQKGGFHRWAWERHRTAMMQVLRFAPDVVPETMIVLTNVPRDGDPFGDDMWFDMAVRLAYPGIPVDGVYFYSDGSPAPNNHQFLEGESWRWERKGFGQMLSSTRVEKTVVVEYDPSGAGKLLETLPPYVCRTSCAAAMYRPSAAITGGPVAPIAARRYNIPPQ